MGYHADTRMKPRRNHTTEKPGYLHNDAMMPREIVVLINPLREVIMRTTLTLDNNVIDKAKAVAAKRRLTRNAIGHGLPRRIIGAVHTLPHRRNQLTYCGLTPKPGM